MADIPKGIHKRSFQTHFVSRPQNSINQTTMKLHLHITIFVAVFVGCVGFSKQVESGDGCYCPEVVYLQHGRSGAIQCYCNYFHFVTWYTKDQFNSNGTPLINFDTTDKKGVGYRSGKYDIGTNGSLIIKNVTLEKDGDYIVIFAQDELKRTNVSTVHVTVIVSPVPVFPVIEDQVNHRSVYMDVNRIGSLTCSLTRVHPMVYLKWFEENSIASEKIHFEHSETTTTQNTDGTYNVSLKSLYEIDTSAKIVTVRCSIIGKIGDFFKWNHSIAELNVLPVPSIPDFPVIDNGSDPQRVYLDVDRTGQLRCVIRNMTDEASLRWEVLEYSPQKKIISESKITKRKVKDNYYDITLYSKYNVKDQIDRIAIECKVTGVEIQDHLQVRRVDLIFKKVPSIPVIDGCFSKQDHCVLETPRTGEVVCTVMNSPNEVDLMWNEDNLPYLDYQNQTRNIQKSGTVFDISITTPYTVLDKSVNKMTVTCISVDPFNKDSVSKAKATLAFREACRGADNRDLNSVPTSVAICCMIAVVIGLVVYQIVSTKRRKPLPGNAKDLEKGVPDSTDGRESKENNSNECTLENGSSHEATELLDTNANNTNVRSIEENNDR